MQNKFLVKITNHTMNHTVCYVSPHYVIAVTLCQAGRAPEQRDW